MEDDDVPDLGIGEVIDEPVHQDRWPTSRVGSIDSEGIWYGLTMNA
jgi:hypothetical protein